MDVHNVEIVKAEYGEKLLLDGKEIKGVKDFSLSRNSNFYATLKLELYVGDVKAANFDRNADSGVLSGSIEFKPLEVPLSDEDIAQDIQTSLERGCKNAVSM